MIILWIFIAILAVVLFTALICYMMAFFAPRKPITAEFDLPEGAIYEPFYDLMITRIKEAAAFPIGIFPSVPSMVCPSTANIMNMSRMPPSN